MKKIISILLAVLMMFSFVTVAFAEGETGTDAPETSVTPDETPEEGAVDLGEYDWLLDLPFWTVGPALKFAKIALKLVNVYLKVAKIFGLVDKDMGDYIIEAIAGLIENAQKGEQPAEDATTTAPSATPALA